MITAETQAEILARYYNQKHAVRRISRELGINRSTVRRVVERRSVQLVAKVGVRSSILDPFKEEIEKLLEKDAQIPATALFNRLRPMGYMGGISILRDFLSEQKMRPKRAREAFLRLDFAAGSCAQIDWGEFGDVFGNGVKIHCFAMVLAHSRYMYIEFTRSERFEDFIRCHEKGFRFFGGVPLECWYDNLTSAVTDRLGALVRFNARFMAYMGHHNIRPHACNVARGNEKGRVEDLIKYIRNNFWPGRSFADFDDLCVQATVWRNNIANQREHRSTRRIVRLHFESEEKTALKPLNPVPYDTDEVFARVVPSDFHILYETNRYSVPWTLVGMAITIRVNAESIKVYYHERFICSHPRFYIKNRVFTDESHRAGLLERKPGASSEGSWQVQAVKAIGPKMSEYVELLRSGQRSLRTELSRILALATVYGEKAVHEAVEDLLLRSVVGVAELELTLKRLHHPSAKALRPAPINFKDQKLNRTHPVVDLRVYDAYLFEGDDIKSASEGEENGNNNDPTGGV